MRDPSLYVSLTALFVAITSAVLAWRQLQEAKTTTGGRGMSLRARHTTEEEKRGTKVPVQFHKPDTHDLLALDFRAVGLAVFFDVQPYSWGPEGASEALSDPAPSLTCNDGLQTVAFIVPKELTPSMKLGVLWREPYRNGLHPGAVRISMDGRLEEWRWYPRWYGRLSFHQTLGRWREVRLPKYGFGPASQPWDRPRFWGLAHAKNPGAGKDN